MELTNFIENFVSQFDETDASVFQADTSFKELDEWSSLMALNILAMVDEEYDVQINGNDIKKSLTVEDLFETIKSKK